MTDTPTEGVRPAIGRRGFITRSALTGGTLAGLVALDLAPALAQSAGESEAAKSGGPSDADILNFALNLEYLEAEFYLRAAFGRGLASRDIGGNGRAGQVDGGRKVDFDTRAIRNYAAEIARDEENHVQFLRQALGGARAARPAINLDEAFTAAARAAGLVGSGQRFDAFANETNFLLAAYIFEDVGVTAYGGAATLIRNRGVLGAAVRIGLVEAYHAGEIRTILYGLGLFTPAQRISDARDQLDGPPMRDQGIGNANVANVVPADRNALTYTRSTRDVLDIVYLGGRNKGGFFPNGLNGRIA